MRDLKGRPDLCAINTATLGFQAPIEEVIEAIARHGFGGIAPWRREIEGKDAKAIGKRIRDAGLAATGYCRSTYLPAGTRAEFDANVEANRRAITDAAAIGAASYVMVVGGMPPGSKDIAGARSQVAEGTAQLLEHARPLGVRIALEPLHPIYAADRSCLSTTDEALDLAERLGPPQEIGVCLDVYHIWWDPYLARAVSRAKGRITALHVCDWLVPMKDVLNDRGMMGDGVIDIPSIRAMVENAGYDGLVEVELFSTENWWKRPMDETLRVCAERLSSVC
ncbi:MAG: sugar phosphate isomerase/epimerase family protein [Parvibaculaceae bacterium]